DFLGFTHYCSKSRNGRFRVKRKTSKKRFAKKCKEMYRLIQKIRNWPLREITKKLNQRSQKKSCSWKGYNDML
ncbi:RNA-directed DNA polymerase, partial [Klebsiella oxytoca]